MNWYLLPLINDMIEKGVGPKEFSDYHMEERMARRKQQGINNNTLRSEIMLANSMFELGVKSRLVPVNPLRGYQMPAKVKPHIPTPTPAHLRKLLKAVHDMRLVSRNPNAAFLTPEKNRFLWRRDTAIIVLDARTGMRPCEPFKLLMEDYQPEAGRVVIRTAKDREPRFVPIYDDVILAVDAWLKVRPKNAASNSLFVSDRGSQMTVAAWSRMFKTYATEAGMPEITPRALRHYGLTAMAEVNLLAASKAAAHRCQEETHSQGRFAYCLYDEAHLYCSESTILSLITRSRHLGMSSIFVTNTPSKLPEAVFRNLDNLIVLPMADDKDDIRNLCRNSFTDAETLTALATRLKPRHALIVGNLTDRYPLVVSVDDLPEGVPRSGVTKSTWTRFLETAEPVAAATVA